MACFKPIEAVQEGGGRLKVGHGTHDRVQGRPLWLPCNQCIGCKQVRARDWATRLLHEAQLHKEKQFITLTYNDKNYTPTLIPKDTQKFIKALRQKNKLKTIKYYITGEYGTETQRPHYHAIIYGHAFTDLTKQTTDLYTSKDLEKIWGKGYCTIGEVNEQTTTYVTKYVTKLVTEGNVEQHYQAVDPRTGEIIDREPEFARMSLKPAIGKLWFLKHWKEVYEARDAIVHNGGKMTPPPKYYDKLLKEHQNDTYEHKQAQRYERSAQWTEDTTPQRLAAREQCAIARHKRKKTAL